MAASELESTHGTVRIPADSVASRTVRIRKPPAEVKAAWSSGKLPGKPEFSAAPEDRGTDLTVELDKEAGQDAEHLLSQYEGKSIDQQLESALRDFKAKLETGEIATIEGQSSGRNE